MNALLRFCKSGSGLFVLMGLLVGLLYLFQAMVLTTALRWLIRFVKDAWEVRDV